MSDNPSGTVQKPWWYGVNAADQGYVVSFQGLTEQGNLNNTENATDIGGFGGSYNFYSVDMVFDGNQYGSTGSITYYTGNLIIEDTYIGPGVPNTGNIQLSTGSITDNGGTLDSNFSSGSVSFTTGEVTSSNTLGASGSIVFTTGDAPIAGDIRFQVGGSTGGGPVAILQFDATNGRILFLDVPTTDPGFQNQLWCDAANGFVLKLSQD